MILVRRTSSLVLVALCGLAAACNAILGNEEAIYIAPSSGGSGGVATGGTRSAGGSGGASANGGVAGRVGIDGAGTGGGAGASLVGDGGASGSSGGENAGGRGGSGGIPGGSGHGGGGTNGGAGGAAGVGGAGGAAGVGGAGGTSDDGCVAPACAVMHFANLSPALKGDPESVVDFCLFSDNLGERFPDGILKEKSKTAGLRTGEVTRAFVVASDPSYHVSAVPYGQGCGGTALPTLQMPYFALDPGSQLTAALVGSSHAMQQALDLVPLWNRATVPSPGKTRIRPFDAYVGPDRITIARVGATGAFVGPLADLAFGLVGLSDPFDVDGYLTLNAPTSARWGLTDDPNATLTSPPTAATKAVILLAPGIDYAIYTIGAKGIAFDAPNPRFVVCNETPAPGDLQACATVP